MPNYPAHIVDAIFVELVAPLKELFATSQKIISVYDGWADDYQKGEFHAV